MNKVHWTAIQADAVPLLSSSKSGRLAALFAGTISPILDSMLHIYWCPGKILLFKFERIWVYCVFKVSQRIKREESINIR